MIDYINSKEYEQAARELPLVEDWTYDTTSNKLQMDFIPAGVGLFEYLDSLNLYTSGKDSLLKFLGCISSDYGKYFINKEVYNYAIPFLELAEGSFEFTLGKTHPYYVSVLNELQVSYGKTGDDSKAASAFIELLNLRKNDFLETTPDYTTFLDSLEIVGYDINSHDYSQAENFYLEVLNIMKPMHKTQYALNIKNPSIGQDLLC